MDLAKLKDLCEQRAQLSESLRVSGRYRLSPFARSATENKLREIYAEIAEIETPAVTPGSTPEYETFGVAELKLYYGWARDNYAATGTRDVRKVAELTAIQTRIQQLEADETAQGDIE